MDAALIVLALTAIVERTTPLELADLKLLIAAYQAAFPRGVYCPCGADGSRGEEKVCVPMRWKEGEWEAHDRTCRHCPVFREVRARSG